VLLVCSMNVIHNMWSCCSEREYMVKVERNSVVSVWVCGYIYGYRCDCSLTGLPYRNARCCECKAKLKE